MGVTGACDGTDVSINTSDSLVASVDETTNKKCIVYRQSRSTEMNNVMCDNNATISNVKVSLLSFTAFITSAVIITLL